MSNIFNQIPLQILTGFLGSGKTTMLNKVVNSPEMKGTVLIINEVGEIPIDDKLISNDNPVIVLDSGCICCSVKEGLVNVLHYLIEEADNNPEFKFNRVIIETTGIADPAPIIDLIFHYEEILINYCFAGTITIVDGVNAKEELAHNYEAVKQIAMADKIIISKTDRLSEDEIETLKATAEDLNQSASIYLSSIDNPPMDAFTSFDIFNTPKDIKTVMNWINSKRSDYKLASGMAPVKLTGVMNKALPTHSNYQTISLSFDKPLNRYTVIHTFDALNSQFGDAIIRLKGIFDFGDGYPFIIHGVKGECYPITNQIEWEDKPFSQMVVIVSPVIAKQVEDILHAMIRPIED